MFYLMMLLSEMEMANNQTFYLNICRLNKSIKEGHIYLFNKYTVNT